MTTKIFPTGPLVEDFLKDVEVNEYSPEAILSIPFLPGNWFDSLPGVRVSERTDQDPVIHPIIFYGGVKFVEGDAIFYHQLKGVLLYKG